MVEIKRDIINWVEEVLESSDDEQYLLIVPPAPTLNKHGKYIYIYIHNINISVYQYN